MKAKRAFKPVLAGCTYLSILGYAPGFIRFCF